MILNPSRDLRGGEWTEIVGLPRSRLVKDGIGQIITIAMRTTVNESEEKTVDLRRRFLVKDGIGQIITIVMRTTGVNESEIRIAIEIGVLLLCVGHLRLHLVVRTTVNESEIKIPETRR
jgi:hypothetical protein